MVYITRVGIRSLGSLRARSRGWVDWIDVVRLVVKGWRLRGRGVSMMLVAMVAVVFALIDVVLNVDILLRNADRDDGDALLTAGRLY